MRTKKSALLAIALILVGLWEMNVFNIANATPSFNDTNFKSTWETEDLPVEQHQVSRSWTWGPTISGAPSSETYNNATRTVQYFDKGRMEVNNPNADRSNIFFVSSGLLVKELVTGMRQDGDNIFNPFPQGAATIPVAGDPNDSTNGFANSNAPTYASFANYTTFNNDHFATPADNSVITASLAKDGTVSQITPPAQVKVVAALYDNVTRHNIVDVFANFEVQTGLIYNPQTKQNQNGAVYFNDPLYIFGHPVSEPYWVTTQVAGKTTEVLVQLFERRVLTYTPSNPAGFQVEMGNVGQHYYKWRYVINQNQVGSPTPIATPTPAPQTGILSNFTQARANYNKTGNNAIPGKATPINIDVKSAINTSVAVDAAANLAFFGTDTSGVYAIDLSAVGGGIAWNFAPLNLRFASSPMVISGTVYIGADDGKVYALDEKTGHGKWATPAADSPIIGSPATDGTNLYFLTQSGKLVAYDLATGQNLKWVFNAAAKAFNGPVLANDGTLYFGTSADGLFAVKDGKQVWQFKGDGVFEAQPALTSDNTTLYATTLNGTVYSFNSSSGAVNWTNHLTPGYSIYTTPAIWDSQLFVGSDNGSEYALDAATGNATSWVASIEGFAPIRSSASVVDDWVYFGANNGHLYSISVTEPGDVRIDYASKAAINQDVPVVNDGKLYFTSGDGHFRVLS